MSDDLKKITILHSNDIHGQFTDETGEEEEACIATQDAFTTLKDYLSAHHRLGRRIDNRCVIRGKVGGFALEVRKGKRKKGLL